MIAEKSLQEVRIPLIKQYPQYEYATLAYTAETRLNTAKTKLMLEVTEKRTLRTIANKTIRDRNRSEQLERNQQLKK
mgnify:CR=1 FL=1